MECPSISDANKEDAMSYLKNFLFSIFVATIAPVFAGEYAFVTPSSSAPQDVPFRIEIDGDTVFAYPEVRALWKATLPKNFPQECLTRAQENAGKPVPCEPTEKILLKRFDPETLAVMDTVERTAHTATLTSSGATVESHPATPVVRKDLLRTLIMTWVVAIGITIVSLMNGWILLNKQRWRIFVFYAAILGTTAFAGVTGWLASVFASGFAGVLIGGFAGVFAGGLAGGLAGGFAGGLAGGFAGGFAGISAVGLAGAFAGVYGWTNAGITEYLVFLGLVCAASFLLRTIIVIARKRMRKPNADTETLEA